MVRAIRKQQTNEQLPTNMSALQLLQDYSDSDDKGGGPCADGGTVATGGEGSGEAAGGGWWDAEWEEPKFKRSDKAHKERKVKRANRRWANKRALCSPEKASEVKARSDLQQKQKLAARERDAGQQSSDFQKKKKQQRVGECEPSEKSTDFQMKKQKQRAAADSVTSQLGPMFHAGSSSSENSMSEAEEKAEEELQHAHFDLKDEHNDEHVRLVFGNAIAMPEGCGTFVDSFRPENRQHHVKRAPKLQVLHARNNRGEEIYAIEGEGGQAAGLNIDEIYRHVQHLPETAATNMATASYRGVDGYGFVGGVGSRFLYTAKAKYKQEKVGKWAVRRGKESQAENILNWVQKGGNATVSRIEKWGRTYQGELKLQRALVDLICGYRGTACFTFPSAMIGVNGGYGTHKDKRDCRRTVWLCTGTGALVFVKYEHILYLHPGNP